MIEFSGIIATIDNFKVETFTRFQHLLWSIETLQARLCDPESRILMGAER